LIVAESQRWKVIVGDEQTSALIEFADSPLDHNVLVLAHGAGGHMEHRHLADLASVFRSRGLHVVRFNFLYKEKKSGPPDRMPKLMATFAAVVARVREELRPGHLFIGGHSMGGRVASMIAANGFACDGLLLLAYPLHPSGQPQKLRDAHLAQITVPTLCLNGTRDELCTRELMDSVVAKLTSNSVMHWLEAADHSFHVLKKSGRTDEEVLDEVGVVTRAWLERIVHIHQQGEPK